MQFVKHSGRYIEENKLKVALVSPPHSPVLSPINGTMNQGIDYDASIPKEPVLSTVGILPSLQTVRSTYFVIFVALNKVTYTSLYTQMHVYLYLHYLFCSVIS